MASWYGKNLIRISFFIFYISDKENRKIDSIFCGQNDYPANDYDD